MTTIIWRKSSRSLGTENSDCVEIARFPSQIGVRDSKNPGTGHLALSGAAWASLVNDIKGGAG